MKIETFFERTMEEEYPNAGKLRRWWERKKMNMWLQQPTGRYDETNEDFIKQIPE